MKWLEHVPAHGRARPKLGTLTHSQCPSPALLCHPIRAYSLSHTVFPGLETIVVSTESIRPCPIVPTIFPGSQPHSYTSHCIARPLLWRTHGLWAAMVGHLSGCEEMVMEMSSGGWAGVGHAAWGLGDRPCMGAWPDLWVRVVSVAGTQGVLCISYCVDPCNPRNLQ